MVWIFSFCALLSSSHLNEQTGSRNVDLISEIKILVPYVLYMAPFALFDTQIREFYGNTFFLCQ